MSAWRGFFISFEGLDGAGKSTQVASLAGSLRQQGHDVVTVRPDETPARRDPAQLRAAASARSGARSVGGGAALHRRARAVAARDDPPGAPSRRRGHRRSLRRTRRSRTRAAAAASPLPTCSGCMPRRAATSGRTSRCTSRFPVPRCATPARTATAARPIRGRTRDVSCGGRGRLRATRRAASAPVSCASTRTRPAIARLARDREGDRAAPSRSGAGDAVRAVRSTADLRQRPRLTASVRLLGGAQHHVGRRSRRVPPGSPRGAPERRGSPGAPGSHPSACSSRASPQVRAWRCWRPSVNVDRPRSRREAEADLPAGAEKRVHLGENGVAGAKRSSPLSSATAEAWHATGLRGLADAGSLRDLLGALSPAALGGQLAWRAFGSREGAARTAPSPRWSRARSTAARRRGRRDRRRSAHEGPSGSTRSPSGGSSTGWHSTRHLESESRACASICCMTHAAVIEPREAALVGQVLHDVIRVEREGAVVTLTIDHPPANAVNGDVVNGLAEGLATAEADETCRAVVITGQRAEVLLRGGRHHRHSAVAPMRRARRRSSPSASRRRGSPSSRRSTASHSAAAASSRSRAISGIAVAHRALRSAGDQARDHPGVGRDPAPAEADRRGLGPPSCCSPAIRSTPNAPWRSAWSRRWSIPMTFPRLRSRWAELLAARAPLALAATKRAMRAGAHLPI